MSAQICCDDHPLCACPIATEKAHATFSASGSKRWLECPGSIRLSEGLPEEPENEYALEGTRAHECLEKFLQAGKAKWRQTAKALYEDYPEEMVNHGLDAAKTIWELTPEGATLLCETRLDATPFTTQDPSDPQWGTADAIIVEEFGTLHVIDYKYGAGVPVEAKDNTQMLYYALAAAHKHDFNFERVAMTIIQPRAPHDEGPVRSATITMGALLDWEPKFLAGVEACKDPSAPLRAAIASKGEDHCRWCPAKAFCPELSNKALREAQVEFDDEAQALSVPGTPAKLKDADTLGWTLNQLPLIRMWINAVEEHAFQRLSKGEAIPGWKLVPKRSTRKWENPEKVEALARKKKWGRLLFEEIVRSPAQFEAAAKKQGVDASPFISEHASNISSGMRLVPDADPRPATNQIEQDFADPPGFEKCKELPAPKIRKERIKKAAAKKPAKRKKQSRKSR